MSWLLRFVLSSTFKVNTLQEQDISSESSPEFGSRMHLPHRLRQCHEDMKPPDAFIQKVQPLEPVSVTGLEALWPAKAFASEFISESHHCHNFGARQLLRLQTRREPHSLQGVLEPIVIPLV